MQPSPRRIRICQRDAVSAIVEAVAQIPNPRSSSITSLKHQRDKVLRNANVSINVDEAFFEAIRNDEDIVMTWRGKEVDRIAATEAGISSHATPGNPVNPESSTVVWLTR